MNKTDKYLLLGGGALAAYWFFSKSTALAHLVFTPGMVTNMYLTGGMPIMQFNVRAQNTSTATLEFRSFAGNVFSNGTLIGNVYNFSPVMIPGNGVSTIPVNVELQAIGLANNLITAFQNKNFSQSILVRGYANVNGIQLPVELDFAVGA